MTARRPPSLGSEESRPIALDSSDTVADPVPVFAELVGQDHVVEVLAQAATAAAAVLRGEAGVGMTHAWLFTGPPGSGRSTAARAFAAALQCPNLGCGQCPACHTVLAGTAADVELVRPSGLSYGVGDTRDLVRRAALSPSGGRWQVIVLEDADRLTEDAANALLKAIEEPPARTVWLLCTPAADDLVPTIRSRCRLVPLQTPPVRAVADVLVTRDGVDPAMAAFAARAAQGHIGRAKRLATDERARLRRAEVLRVPLQVVDVPSCLTAAANLVEAAEEEAREATVELDAVETAELRTAYGEGSSGRGLARGAEPALKDLERRQRTRAKRLQRDAIDRALVDLASFYRDVITVQVGAEVPLTNDEMRPAVRRVAESSTAEQSLRRVDAILACREAVDANVAPLLAVEAMTLTLRAP
jgi:DNA polymerase III subunit delta'